MNFVTPPSPSLLHAASEAIFKAWLPRIGEIEARKEAERFARRFQVSIDAPVSPILELQT